MHRVHLRTEDDRTSRALAARLGQSLAELDKSDVVVDLSRPGDGRRARWATDLEAGRSVVARSLDPGDATWAEQQWAAGAAARGLVLLPNGGMFAVLGDVLACLAASAVEEPVAVHSAHLVAESGGLVAAGDDGLRAELASLLGRPAVVVRNGTPVEEPAGEGRRLAWFARPVGPHHAATVPAPEVVTIRRHVPGAATIAGHLAVRAWRAEVLQAAGNLARWPGPRTALQRRITRPRPAVEDARWAVVAEAEGRDGVARAWANGRDLAVGDAAVLSAMAAAVAEHAGAGQAGVPAPAQLVDPGSLLDDLAAADVLRWSVVRPS